MFEESGQGISSQNDDVDPASGGRVGITDPSLAVVVEEEEEEESQPPGQTRKRKANVLQEEEIETGGDIEMLDAEGPLATKKVLSRP